MVSEVAWGKRVSLHAEVANNELFLLFRSTQQVRFCLFALLTKVVMLLDYIYSYLAVFKQHYT